MVQEAGKEETEKDDKDGEKQRQGDRERAEG